MCGFVSDIQASLFSDHPLYVNRSIRLLLHASFFFLACTLTFIALILRSTLNISTNKHSDGGGLRINRLKDAGSKLEWHVAVMMVLTVFVWMGVTWIIGRMDVLYAESQFHPSSSTKKSQKED